MKNLFVTLTFHDEDLDFDANFTRYARDLVDADPREFNRVLTALEHALREYASFVGGIADHQGDFLECCARQAAGLSEEALW